MNGILVINKEKNMTSRDVVNEVCKKLGTKHIGHTGTLDPLATGVLVLGVNEGCKIIDLLTSSRKTYEAEIVMGLETDTLDVTGKVLNEVDVNITKDKIIDVINNFPRVYMQEVPKYSAIHVNGKRLYEYARSEEEVELPKRKVEIYSLELINADNNIFRIKCDVSKGTYIRSLIRDIGNILGVPCTMKELKRTKQGIFEIKDAYNLDEANNNIKLISILDALANYDKIVVEDDTIKKIKNGMILKLDTEKDLVLVVDKSNSLLAIYKRYEKDKTLMKPYRVFKEDL